MVTTGGDAAHGIFEIANHAGFNNIVGVDFGGGAVDMDDLFVVLGVSMGRIIFDHVVANANDQVSLIDTKGDQVVCLQTDGAEVERMGGRRTGWHPWP